jgi:hypothetical protein
MKIAFIFFFFWEKKSRTNFCLVLPLPFTQSYKIKASIPYIYML